MILAEMARWRTAPGTVLTLGPTPASLAAAAGAPVDSAPPSFLQADHLRAYAARRRAGGVHRAWTGVATDLDGPLDRDALARALTRLVTTHEGLRSWFDLTGEVPVRHVVPVADVEHAVVDVRELEVEDGSWDEALQAHLVRTFDAACRPDAWPGFVLGAVEHADGFGLFWGCDHAFTDGASQLMVASELADLYAAEVAEPGGPALVEGALPTPQESGPFGVFAAEERARAATYDASSPEVRAWTDLVESRGGRLPSFPLDLGLEPGTTAPVHIASYDLLDAGAASRLDARCRALGVRTVSAVFAALAATDHLLAGRATYAGVTVLGARDTGPYLRSHGWFCTFAPVLFEVAPHADDLDALLVAAHAGFESGRRTSRMPAHVALAEMLRTGVLGPDGVGSPQLVSYLDVRRFPGAGRTAHERGVHFTGEGRTANASMWVNRDAERLYVGLQHPDAPEAHDAVARYSAVLARVAGALAEGSTSLPEVETSRAGHVG